MKSTLLHTLLAAGLLLIAPACADRESAAEERAEANREQQVGEAGDAIEREWQVEREEARTNIQNTRARIDSELQELDARAAKANAETKAQLEERRRELQANRQRLDTRLERWEQETEQGWKDTRDELREDLRAIGETLDRRVGEDNVDDHKH